MTARSHGTLQVGSRVFVGPYETEDVYDVREVSAINVAAATVEVVSPKGGVGTVSLAQCFAMNAKHNSDLCGLHNIHEPGILANLEARISSAEPLAYTYLNTVLVAVNPLKVLTNQPQPTDYADGSFDPEKPHPYAIAELAYQNLKLPRDSEPSSQSIVISGESGAGKTETAKIVLSFLSNRSSSDGVVDVGNARVSECILDSTPIFEEFGNAKTLRNNNSSRFGKFISLQFSPSLSYTLVGAYVTTYLLEKTRVCYQMTGERNYHIFYDLLRGAASDSSLCLDGDPMEYFYLSQSVPIGQVPEAAELGMFEHVCHSMEVIGIDQPMRSDLWRVLSGILHLGNTAIVEADTVEGLKAGIEDKRHAALAANMLGVDTDSLVALLTVRRTTIRGQEIVIKLQRDDATFRRDAVAKALYASAFEWIVQCANDHLGYKAGAPLPFIGVLDIFGFESFAVNGLEQVLINFANEYLQNVFNKQVFESELKLFAEENILCALDDCPDNKPCVDLLAGKGGILEILNAQSSAIQPSEDKFVRDLAKDFKLHGFFPEVHRKDARDSFKVLHFAGPVHYTVKGWLLKNSDPLPETAGAVFGAGSQLPLVRKLFADELKSEEAAAAGRGASKSSKKDTVAAAFVRSMRSLTTELSQTKCNFIRCIKPNALMRAGLFHRAYVVDQLRCLGILATCEVLKAGMPTRVTYKELRGALAGLPAQTMALFGGQPEEVLIAASMWAFEVPADAYQLGRSRVFFKAGEISRVEAILKSDLSGVAGDHINGRMVLALERRQKALEAVLQVEALMAKAKPGVEAASLVLEDVDDTARQIARDSGGASEQLTNALAAKAAAAKAASDAEAALTKVGDDPRCRSLSSTDAAAALAAAEVELEAGQAALALLGGGMDPSRLRHDYAALKGAASDLAADTRAVVGEVVAAMARVALLHREASDGAKRCLLDYTLERTSAAEAECEGLLALVAEIQEGGAAGAKAGGMAAQNDQLRDAASACAAAVGESAQTVAGHATAVQEHLKTVRAEMRRAESAVQAAAAAEKALATAAALAAGEEVAGDSAERASLTAFGNNGGAYGGGGASSELAATVAALAAKVATMEAQHGDQLRALVAKTKELHRVVKYQQEQLAALGAAGSGNGSNGPVLSHGLPHGLPLGVDDDGVGDDGVGDDGVGDDGVGDDGVGDDGVDDAPLEASATEPFSTPPPSEDPASDNPTSEDPTRVAPREAIDAAAADAAEPAAAEAEMGLEEATSKILSQAMRDADSERPDKAEASEARMREREALLRERVDAQAVQLTSLEASSEARAGAAEAKVAALEAALEALQAKVSALLGGSTAAPNMRAVAMSRARPDGRNDGGQQPAHAASAAAKAAAAKAAGRGRSPVRTTPPKVAGPAVLSLPEVRLPEGDVSSSRLSLWANIRDRMFGGTAPRARLLNLTILEATFHDTSRNQKLPLDAYIEIRNITTGQVETTSTVRKSYKPKYNEHFVFRTKQNANDMIMMKIMEHSPTGGATIFGSVALPLDSKHTQGAQIPMPIFDEGLNMKGVVRVAALWSSSYPRRLKLALQGVQDVPEALTPLGTLAACRLVAQASGQTLASEKVAVTAGCCDLKGRVLEGLEMHDESDRLSLELVLFADGDASGALFGRADVALPGDGPGMDEAIVVVNEASGGRAVVFLRAAWVE